MARKYILDKNGSGTILARKYFLDAGWTESRDDQPKAGRGWETAISGAKEFIWTKLHETFFLLWIAVNYHILSVYDPASKKCSRIKRSKDAKYPERWSCLHGDYFSYTLESFTVWSMMTVIYPAFNVVVFTKRPSFIASIFAGAYRVSNRGTRRKLFRRDTCHLSRVHWRPTR